MVNVYSNQVKYAVSRSVHGAKKKKTTCPLKLLFISKRWICHMHPLGQRPSQISKVKE